MDFYYHPILGLQWTGNFVSSIVINLDALPKDIESFKEAWDRYQSTGIQFVNPDKYQKAFYEYPQIKSN